MLRTKKGNLHLIITGGLAITMLIGGVGVAVAQGEEPVEEPQITPEPQDVLSEAPIPYMDDEGGIIELQVDELDTNLLLGDISLATLGTAERVADIYSGGSGSYPEYLAVYNDKLYFSANGDGGKGCELWMYDGLNPPSLVADIYVGSSCSYPSYMTVFKNKLYFGADGGGVVGTELWSYDGTSASCVSDIHPSLSSNPGYLTVYNNKLYFSADGGDGKGRELWVYDGVNPPKRVADIYPGSNGSYPDFLKVFKNKLYFGADGGDGKGKELWVYDGIHKPYRVANIYSGSNSSSPMHLEVYNMKLYFSAIGSNDSGRELWAYDGSHEPSLVADIMSGSSSSYPKFLKVFNNVLFFAANGGDDKGNELWAYDGNQAPFRVADIYAGGTSSSPSYLTVFGDGLYFGANEEVGGNELWRYHITNIYSFSGCSIPELDGYVLESSETSSKGGYKNNTRRTLWVGDDKYDRQYRGVLHFNTSTIPDEAIFIYAALGVKRAGVVGRNPFTTHGNIYVDIKSGAFSGRNALQVSDWQAAASKLTVATIKNNPDEHNVYSAKLPSVYFKFINRTGVTQFRLRFSKGDNDDRGADYLKFYSGENAFPSCPLLMVIYSKP